MKISNQLLDAGFLYPLMQQTLTMYLEGKDLTQSPVAQWGRKTLAEGKWWYGVEKLPESEREEGIRQRIAKIVALFEAIRKYGYVDSGITVKFDADGNLLVHDGFHRLCILKFLGLKVKVSCKVKVDFPLLEVLRELNNGENLYQPTGDPRTVGWHLWRTDCLQRLNLIRQYVDGVHVLDGGCESGYFSRALSAEGYSVTAADSNPKRAAVAKYLAATQNIKCSFAVSTWQKVLSEGKFDTVLLLSVLHHDAVKRGIRAALGELSLLAGKCRRVILEFPLESEGIYWIHGGGHRWSFNHQELAQLLEAITGFRVVVILECVSPNRPIFVLEAKC